MTTRDERIAIKVTKHIKDDWRARIEEYGKYTNLSDMLRTAVDRQVISEEIHAQQAISPSLIADALNSEIAPILDKLNEIQSKQKHRTGSSEAEKVLAGGIEDSNEPDNDAAYWQQ
jgi:Arc/MetJ-type ribon-helix-helix transcriptional regulator